MSKQCTICTRQDNAPKRTYADAEHWLRARGKRAKHNRQQADECVIHRLADAILETAKVDGEPAPTAELCHEQ